MKKRGPILVIVIILFVLALISALVLYLKGGPSSFSFSSFSTNFLAGTDANGLISEGAQGNIFEGVKLNPFSENENVEE